MAKITKQTEQLLDFLYNINNSSCLMVWWYCIDREGLDYFIKNNLDFNDLLAIKQYQRNMELYIHNPSNKDIYEEHAKIKNIFIKNNINWDYFWFKDIDETIKYIKEENKKKKQNNHIGNEYTDKKWYVYLIKQGEYYKIWKTIDLKSRFKKYITENPNECELIHSYLVDEYWREEERLHKRFAHKNHNREWFLLDDNDVEYIKTLKLI